MELQVKAPEPSQILAGAKRLAEDIDSPLGIDHVTAMVLAKWIDHSYSALRLHCFNVFMSKSFRQAGFVSFDTWLTEILQFANLSDNTITIWRDGVTELLPALAGHETFEVALELGEKKWQTAVAAGTRLIDDDTPSGRLELHELIRMCKNLGRDALRAELLQHGLTHERPTAEIRHVEKLVNDTYHSDLSGGQRLVILYIALKEGARIHCETYGQKDGLSRQAVAHQLALLEGIGKEHVDLVNVDGKWLLREFLKDDECPRELTPLTMDMQQLDSTGKPTSSAPSLVISVASGSPLTTTK